MKEERFRFLELLGNIDDELIYLSCQPWEEKTRNIMRIHVGKAVACAVLVFVLCIAGIFHQQVEAAIHSFTTKIAELLGVSGNLTPYIEIIGDSQTREGITVTLEEVLLAENQLYVAMHVEWDESVELGQGMQAPGFNIKNPKINGEETMTVNSGIELSNPEENVESSQNVLATFVYTDDGLPHQINGIEIEAQAFLENNLEEEGISFFFDFLASKEELEKDTYSTAIDCELKSQEGVSFHLNQLQFNKIFSRISVSSDIEQELENAVINKDYFLLGKDSEGNALKYELLNKIDYGVFESKGTLPSADCEWIELQLHEVEIPMSENAGNTQDTIVIQPGSEDRIEMECSEVYSVDELEYVPVGEKVRISLPRVSESDVDALIAAKGIENLTWEDFARYPHTDIGSGQFVFEYPLTESGRLYLTGSSLHEPPQRIYIIRRDGTKKEFKR